ncbi:phage holin family protein [Modestobacter sp. I12A-02628]|uniref:Phage holin family protein n=1 Tax=Goekera deserti TaxID=2497753 RepID=A0A7K3WAM1_9ACTN|nr:phage holin family protein [Goekera deserti]MPQ97641.1 phage holin family protein [Goekera deserti]NDI47754.1 phage holin family protein [Goekera deserti]NEL53502.1 phage holin family protein [Goekera deserti]
MSSPVTGAGASRASTTTTAQDNTTATLDPRHASTGQLLGDLTDQVTRLVRNEVALAQAEVTGKAKKLGVGAGLFGGAGLFAFFGTAVLVAAAVLGLAHVVPDWLAAVIVAVVLFVVAAVLALVGKKDVAQASPPVPTQAIDSVKADLATVKAHASKGGTLR